jgi:hypothetical protein
MAATPITPVSLKMNEFVKESATTLFAAVDANEGATFEMPDRDEKYVIGVQNAASSSVNVFAVLKAGDGLHSVMGDEKVTLAQNAIAWITIDSARFKNITGNNKGKVVIRGFAANGTTGTTDLKVKVIKLP